MPGYREDQVSRGPTWLQRAFGAAWLTALGDTKDALVARLKAAVKARFALLAPFDALAQLGIERQIERLPFDTNATFAARLKGAWSSWPTAGTAFGLLQALSDSGYRSDFTTGVEGPRIMQVLDRQFFVDGFGTKTALALPPGSWLIDTNQTFWSKFEVVFPFPHPWVVTGLPAANGDEVNRLRALIDKWKPGHAICSRITVQESGNLWGFPIRSWGDAGITWGGAATHFTC